MKLALGFFDSVHLGHSEVIKRADMTLSFSNNPFTILGKNCPIIYTISERELLLGGKAIAIEFTKEVMQMPYQQFLELLIEKTGACEMVCGEDFALGKERKGDVANIKEYLQKRGIPLTVVPTVTMNGEKISSSKIRKHLENGEIEKANQALGRSFFYMGKVIKGLGRGKRMGLPTVNLEIDKDKILAKSGVYKSITQIGKEKYSSITHIGEKPTFLDKNFTIETHIVNFNGDIYGEQILVYLEKFLRENKKFTSPKELVDNILSYT